MAQEITRLEQGTKRFEANGKTFVVHEGLTTDGFQRLEELRVEMEFGYTPAQMKAVAVKQYEDFNKSKVADATVKCYNLIHATERIETRQPMPWLLALTLFVRPEGADLSAWKLEDAVDWVQDWNAEGIAVADLFTLASGCNKRLDTDFLASFPDTFSEKKSEETGEQSKPEAAP